ncbi:MAG: prepilin-type N-terminal cleavage/methylation domain-containing protein [Bacilli bacterium]|nr:prepilin-type N-terminal cleavage/methylation domain-containing protein [Bacilli bacterium]
MRENRNGFTLVELLVTLSILGIITALSIPIIRNVQTQQTNRKYTTYLDSLGYASKLYVDSYSEDLFGYYARGCRYIKYEDLKKRDLIKDIDIKGISCDTEYTAIKVVKFRDKYYYQPYMGCGSETGGTVNASIFKPKQIENEDLCDANLNNTLIIREAYSAEEKRKIKQEHNPKVAIESYTGVSLTEKPQVKYAYIRSDKANASDMTLEDLNNMAKSWSDYISFDLFTDIEQNKFIKKAKLMTTYSNDKLTTHLNSDPQLTGTNFWLVLKVDRLKDYEGYDWKKIENPEGIENYVFFGPYIVDNTKPTVVGNTVTITSSETSYHHKKVTVRFKVDDNMTAKNKIKVCVSAANNCTDADYKTYSGGNVSKEITFTGSYDGNKRTVYIKVMDEAGNKLGKTNDTYIVYKECSETKPGNDWKNEGTCSKKCGGGKQKQYAFRKDKYLNTQCTEKDYKEIDCNKMGCCSETNDVTGNWVEGTECSKACGSGKKKRTRTIQKVSKYDGSNCGNPTTETDWGGSACNTQDCCSSTKVVEGNWVEGSDCSVACGGGTKKRTRTSKNISNYDGSDCGAASTETDWNGSACNTQDCCSSTTASRGAWSDYGECSKLCNGGRYHRRRTITYTSNYDGSDCGSEVETDAGGSHCNTQSCCNSTEETIVNCHCLYGCCRHDIGIGGSHHFGDVSCLYKKTSTYDGSYCGTTSHHQHGSCRDFKDICPDCIWW